MKRVIDGKVYNTETDIKTSLKKLSNVNTRSAARHGATVFPEPGGNMKAVDIIERLPAKPGGSRDEYQRWVHRAIREAGHKPVRAEYDQFGNCIICGEAGRCPGWHTADEIGGVGALRAREG